MSVYCFIARKKYLKVNWKKKKKTPLNDDAYIQVEPRKQYYNICYPRRRRRRRRHMMTARTWRTGHGRDVYYYIILCYYTTPITHDACTTFPLGGFFHPLRPTAAGWRDLADLGANFYRLNASPVGQPHTHVIVRASLYSVHTALFRRSAAHNTYYYIFG